MGCMLTQEYEDRVERAIYYLSKKMLDYETRYTPLKKACLALALTGRLARWLLLFFEFDLKYVTRKSIKGRAVAEFLADHLVEGDEEVEYLFPDEAILQVEEKTWTMYFDGTSNHYGYGIGVLVIAPDDSHMPLAFKLQFKVSYNEVAYEACIAGLEATLEQEAMRLDVIRAQT
ncbi:uncharacterized protein LOC114318117 [Camellia sinensis]|uniref:uncharacterized protein LOC114318117 n=1 Tax=Camellia sinensis TaxID=4442 RepID=UPI001035CA47|nr:uncharacterized protein LOC114318117 [Camellia sinensis]